MEPKAIEKIAQRLDAAGHDSGELHDLQVELDILEKPPSLWQRMHRSAQEFASRQWEMLAGELQESKLAMQITVKALRSRDSVTAEELHFVREQMMDLLRVLPAGAVIFANAALPLPATSILTPQILHKLGLMPSMWREAHLLSHLQNEVNRLKAVINSYKEIIAANQQKKYDESLAMKKRKKAAFFMKQNDENSREGQDQSGKSRNNPPSSKDFDDVPF